MIDVASGGALMDKTPATARHLISNMASNIQQFGIRGVGQPWMVNKVGVVDNLRLENQLTELTSLIRQLAIRQHQPSIVARGRVKGLMRLNDSDLPRMHLEVKMVTDRQIRNTKHTIPTTTTIENVISRQLTISRRPDEAISNKQSGVPTKHEL
ncbi:hypothetical protein CR513_11159, partial [Mucuna pruriens]